MAVWGAQTAREDDALRAVRAGVLIRDRVSRLHVDLHLPQPLSVRVGVSSGFVAVGGGPADQLIVTGATVNLAARLQSSAHPGEVLVAATTRELTEANVAYGEEREISARGFDEPIAGWPVVSLTARTRRRTIPLVGRRAELETLVDLAALVAIQRRPRLVAVMGEAGIGKTRLLEELVAALPGETTVLGGRATEFAEDPTYAPVAEMIRRQIDVSAETPRDEVHQRLQELVDGCCDPNERAQVAARVGLVLGMGIPADEADGTDGEEGDEGRGRSRAAGLRQGLRRLLRGMAERGPLLMVVDDAHLARPELLELLDSLMRDDLPLLVILAGRSLPAWERGNSGAGVPSTTLRLTTLSTEESIELARNAGGLGEHDARELATHSGGNPFFLIETTGLLMERAIGPMSPFEAHRLPATVQAVIASRLDHLPPAARDLARRAAVLTRSTFDPAELSLIADPDEPTLAILEENEVLVRDPRRRLWRFRHDLLRDVAYESLSKRQRMELHVRLAEGLAARDPERYPASVAHHLAAAARAALDLDPRDRRLADRAIDALTEAGDRFRRRTESRAAIELYERALTLAGQPEEWGEREARILSKIGEGRYWLAEFESARRSLARARELAPESLWVRAHATRFLADIHLNVDGDPDTARRLFEQAVAAADALDDPKSRARAHLMSGWVPYWVGDLAGARAAFERSLEIVRSNPAGDAAGESRALVALASVTSPTGTATETLLIAERALEIGRRLADPFLTGVGQETVGNSLARMGRISEARAALDESVRLFRELGARWELASALGDRGNVARLDGRLDDAADDLREALANCRELGEQNLITWTAATLGQVELLRGNRTEAGEMVEEVERHRHGSDPGDVYPAITLRLLIAIAEGDRARVEELADRLMRLDDEGSAWQNPLAARQWWVGHLLGAELAGGEGTVAAARARLVEVGWQTAIAEPDLIRAALDRLGSPIAG
jgi:tetratricopeptide (TPR) repeat protein